MDTFPFKNDTIAIAIGHDHVFLAIHISSAASSQFASDSAGVNYATVAAPT